MDSAPPLVAAPLCQAFLGDATVYVSDAESYEAPTSDSSPASQSSKNASATGFLVARNAKPEL